MKQTRKKSEETRMNFNDYIGKRIVLRYKNRVQISGILSWSSAGIVELKSVNFTTQNGEIIRQTKTLLSLSDFADGKQAISILDVEPEDSSKSINSMNNDDKKNK